MYFFQPGNTVNQHLKILLAFPLRASLRVIIRYTIAVLLTGLLLSSSASARQDLVLGVYAYRPAAIMQQRYQPLINYLNKHLTDYQFHLRILELNEFQPAIERKQIDFIFTNPRHYIILRTRNNFFGAIATMLKKSSDGRETRHLGGVIFTLKNRQDINKLEDLKNQRIAIPSRHNLGGFQTQSYELYQIGINIDRDTHLVLSGTHNQVVDDVLSGKVDVGFIRTEILEELQEQGKIDLFKIKIINRQHPVDFPFIISTRLYPEWPFLALQHVDLKTVSQVSAALLMLKDQHPAAIASGIAGFAPPADYLPVEQVARVLRLAPYEQIPELSFYDIWKQHENGIIIGLVFLTIILILILVLLRQNRNIYHSETLKQLILNSAPEMIWLKDTAGKYLLCNPIFARFVNREVSDIEGRTDDELFKPDLAQTFQNSDQDVINKEQTLTKEQWITFPDTQQELLLEITKTPLTSKNGNIIGVLGLGHDITERKKVEERQRITSTVFINSQQSIIITNAQNIIMEVNPAACQLTGYSEQELIGKTPSILKSGEHSKRFYEHMWNDLNTKGKWSGELLNKKKNGEFYTEFLNINVIKDDLGQVQHYIAIFSDLSYLKEHQQQLEYIAYNDSLTKLPNRLLLADRLEQALSLAERQNLLVAIAYLDLDGFKIINDHYGHEAGDQVLIEIANRLKQTLRSEDTVARLGGDEFVLLIVNLQAIEELELLIERIIEQINLPIILNKNTEVSVSASIGISLSHFDDNPPEILLRHADYAMYQAKKQGKNQYCFFKIDDANQKSKHALFQDSIRAALTLNQFELYYQPKINMSNGDILGFEALIRWNHPEKGFLLPAEFLPLIERNQLIIEVGNWVAEQAVQQLQKWHKKGLKTSISINIAALQIQQSNFIKKIKGLFSKYPDVEPRYLELEVLESVVLQDINKAKEILSQCKHFGLKLSLDDFGSGYSSLTYLKELPVDTIKFDRTFIQDIIHNRDNVTILETLIQLCVSLNKTPLAEGIETDKQGSLLLHLGCPLAQGFGIARPMPAHHVRDWVKNYQPPGQWLQHQEIDHNNSKLSILHLISQHNNFVERILDAVNDKALSLFPKNVHDSNHCAFGQWLAQQKNTPLGRSELYQKIVIKHNDAHNLAKAIFDCLKTTRTMKPDEYCEQLLQTHNELIDLLIQLYLDSNLIPRHSFALTKD